ncbi:hypothetical protein KBD20_03775 [Candidatus Saccharibacteria bacterium]|nr:hypothetical protein [Candidatus Saccharibacteria bacterium]
MSGILSTLAQVSSDYNTSYSTYSTTTTTTDPAAAAAAMTIILVALVIGLLLYIFISVCLMKIFKKAGRKDAWAAFIPLYNMYVFFEVAGRPGWWAFLSLIPMVGGVAAVITQIIGSLDMAKSFGKSTGYGIVLALFPLIGYPMLAFGSASYSGPAGPDAKPSAAPMGATPPMQPQPVQNFQDVQPTPMPQTPETLVAQEPTEEPRDPQSPLV